MQRYLEKVKSQCTDNEKARLSFMVNTKMKQNVYDDIDAMSLPISFACREGTF